MRPSPESGHSSNEGALATNQILVDKAQYQAFHLSLPPHHQYERFHFCHLEWNIVLARYLLATYPREEQVLRVEGAAKAYGLDTPIHEPEVLPDGRIRFHPSIVKIDPAFAMGERIDPNRPVILVQIALPEMEEPFTVLIDGMHRLYRASMEKRETIPCFMLSCEEEALCRC